MSDHADFVSGLRALADWYEAHPEQPRMYGAFQVFVETRAELVSAAHALGIARKAMAGDWFWLSRQFGGGVELQVNVKRAAVCTRRVVGTRVIPASPKRLEEIVNWDCGHLLEDLPAAETLETAPAPGDEPEAGRAVAYRSPMKAWAREGVKHAHQGSQ